MTAEPEAYDSRAAASDPLRALLAISRAMHGDGDERATPELIVKEAADFLGADRAALFWRDPQTHRLSILASNGLTESYLKAVDVNYERSAGGLVSKLRRPMVIVDSLTDPRVAPELREAVAREGFRSQLILPLAQAGTLYGGLTLYWDEPPAAERSLPVDLDLAQLFADQATAALLSAMTLDEARRRGDAATHLAAERLQQLEEAGEALTLALDELMQLDRLKGDFLSAVSHELRTPLTTILGFSEFLEEGVAGPISAEQRRFVRQIGEAANQLTALVDDLLDFARMEAGRFRLDPRPLHPGPILEDVLESLERPAKQGRVAIDLDVPADLPEVLADPPRLRQVCLNLLTNAIKFTPEGGHVQVSARVEAGDQVRIEVRDTGIGVPLEAQPHLFKKFFRVQSGLTSTTKGTGLGLAIAKQLVDAQGGHIGVVSEPGHGSTFWFTLPVVSG